MKIPNVSGRTGPIEAAYFTTVLGAVAGALVGWWAVPIIAAALAYEAFNFSDEDGDQ